MFKEWECVPNTCDLQINPMHGYQTLEHPLKLTTVTVMDSKGTRNNQRNSFASSRTSSSSLLGDPLDGFGLALDGSDPLSQLAQELGVADALPDVGLQRKLKKREKDNVLATLDEELPQWSTKRLGILNRFTTSEKLSISTSFLSTGGAKDAIKAQTVVADKVKYRLEQLDSFEDGSVRHMMDLTQQEYIQRIEQLNQELVKSWNSDHRVKALKIAIQCAKMLSDTSVMAFYPSQFVLITDILDIFGKLVYERLNQKADSGAEAGTSADVLRENARETCQNWFFKIASIREMLPRLYVEMAIFKCYEFLAPSQFDENLLRLTKMLRGIGDTLVGTYARCYLVRVGLRLTQNKQFIRENFLDFLNVYNNIFSPTIRSELTRRRLDVPTYLSLYGPAVDFMLEALVHKDALQADLVLKQSKTIKQNGLLVLSILNAFTAEFVAANAMDLIGSVSHVDTQGISKAQLFRALGKSVSRCAPVHEQRLAFLHEALATMNTFSDIGDYVTSVETWAPFIAENFTVGEVNHFLGYIVARMTFENAYEKFYAQLQNILDKIIQNFKEIDLLLVQEHFLPYLDLFHKESLKIDVCKNILTHYKRLSPALTGDAIVLNALMYIGKTLNDSVTSQTVEDQRRQISQLVSNFIQKVDFGRNFEQQLSFYVEARGTFANLDAVYITLVHAVNKLSMETHRLMNGTHNRKTASFVRGCVAFAYITIPSIASVQVQMDLYLLSGQVALLNLCLGQADACFEAALQLVCQLPRSIEIDGKMTSLETYVVSYLSNMLGTLIVVPDSPEQGVLYLLNVLLDVMPNFPFELHSSGPSTIYLHVLDMLYVQSLEEFPYHIPDVVSNDELYGHDPKFIAEVNELCAVVVEHIVNDLKSLGSAQQHKKQAHLALLLFGRIVRYANLNRRRIFELCMDLWMLACKERQHLDDPKQVGRTLKWVEDTFKSIQNVDIRRGECLGELLVHMRRKL